METTTTSTDNGVTLAKTILDQMGGLGRIAMMVGGKNFTSIPNGVVFRFTARAKNSSNAFRVVLAADDTYTIEFIWIRGSKTTIRKELEMVYAEDLKRIFESETGLFLSF